MMVIAARPSSAQDEIDHEAAALVTSSDEWNLFHPQPRALSREMSADRPDTTESPFTVPAGAVQLEMSFVDYANEGDAETWTIAPLNLKFGLCDSADLQIVFEPWIRADAGAGSSIVEGIGNTELRLKLNVWGNDGACESAFALMPYVRLPTADDDLGHDHIEGGLILPWATDLAEGIGLGLMAEFDAVYDEADDDYDLEFLHTAAFGFDVSERIGWYLEGIGIASCDADYRGLVGTGFTFAARDDLQLDIGVNFGLTGEVDDCNVFAGMTVRF